MLPYLSSSNYFVLIKKTLSKCNEPLNVLVVPCPLSPLDSKALQEHVTELALVFWRDISVTNYKYNEKKTHARIN